MDNINLEKKINKLDNDIDALKRVKKYLSNIDEINEIIDVLNEERQTYADEIYFVDGTAYNQCIEYIKPLIGNTLKKEEQIELLEFIKDKHNRKCPNISKKSYGLNAWLKHLGVNCEWIEVENSEWADLIIKGYDFRY